MDVQTVGHNHWRNKEKISVTRKIQINLFDKKKILGIQKELLMVS